ncbi:MAG: protein-L-isoaspartate(D-aspartate) O-methyltransferase [Anaerolineales bacterium]|nr:protein-L-isoaspartate(D-aspartate) O-methyltransferase [Anaerolineales bacterium]
MSEEALYVQQRKRMVEEQIARRGVRGALLLEAFRQTPRHCFVPPEYQHMAYSDGPLPIGEGQTISQPYIVALMTQLLALEGDENVLEVGTGSGYQAAILAHLAHTVHSIERYAILAQRAQELLDQLGFKGVSIHIGDGSLGLPQYAPFDAIIVTAAAPEVPQPLLDQLAEGGRLVVPVGNRGWQMLERYLRCGDRFDKESITPVAFVPLRGQHGWKEDRWGNF